MTSVEQAGDQAAVKKLFVYGSFLEGFSNYKKVLEGKVISRTPGRVRGLLFHQTRKGYPAMISGEGWVHGEFLELEDFDAIIPLCDRIEDYFGLHHPDNIYERRLSEVELENGKCPAWVYWYILDDLGSPENPVVPLPSGNWREFMRGKNNT